MMNKLLVTLAVVVAVTAAMSPKDLMHHSFSTTHKHMVSPANTPAPLSPIPEGMEVDYTPLTRAANKHQGRFNDHTIGQYRELVAVTRGLTNSRIANERSALRSSTDSCADQWAALDAIISTDECSFLRDDCDSSSSSGSTTGTGGSRRSTSTSSSCYGSSSSSSSTGTSTGGGSRSTSTSTTATVEPADDGDDTLPTVADLQDGCDNCLSLLEDAANDYLSCVRSSGSSYYDDIEGSKDRYEMAAYIGFMSSFYCSTDDTTGDFCIYGFAALENMFDHADPTHEDNLAKLDAFCPSCADKLITALTNLFDGYNNAVDGLPSDTSSTSTSGSSSSTNSSSSTTGSSSSTNSSSSSTSDHGSVSSEEAEEGMNIGALAAMFDLVCARDTADETYCITLLHQLGAFGDDNDDEYHYTDPYYGSSTSTSTTGTGSRRSSGPTGGGDGGHGGHGGHGGDRGDDDGGFFSNVNREVLSDFCFGGCRDTYDGIFDEFFGTDSSSTSTTGTGSRTSSTGTSATAGSDGEDAEDDGDIREMFDFFCTAENGKLCVPAFAAAAGAIDHNGAFSSDDADTLCVDGCLDTVVNKLMDMGAFDDDHSSSSGSGSTTGTSTTGTSTTGSTTSSSCSGTSSSCLPADVEFFSELICLKDSSDTYCLPEFAALNAGPTGEAGSLTSSFVDSLCTPGSCIDVIFDHLSGDANYGVPQAETDAIRALFCSTDSTGEYCYITFAAMESAFAGNNPDPAILDSLCGGCWDALEDAIVALHDAADGSSTSTSTTGTGSRSTSTSTSTSTTNTGYTFYEDEGDAEFDVVAFRALRELTCVTDSNGDYCVGAFANAIETIEGLDDGPVTQNDLQTICNTECVDLVFDTATRVIPRHAEELIQATLFTDILCMREPRPGPDLWCLLEIQDIEASVSADDWSSAFEQICDTTCLTRVSVALGQLRRKAGDTSVDDSDVLTPVEYDVVCNVNPAGELCASVAFDAFEANEVDYFCPDGHGCNSDCADAITGFFGAAGCCGTNMIYLFSEDGEDFQDTVNFVQNDCGVAFPNACPGFAALVFTAWWEDVSCAWINDNPHFIAACVEDIKLALGVTDLGPITFECVDGSGSRSNSGDTLTITADVPTASADDYAHKQAVANKASIKTVNTGEFGEASTTGNGFNTGVEKGNTGTSSSASLSGSVSSDGSVSYSTTTSEGSPASTVVPVLATLVCALVALML